MIWQTIPYQSLLKGNYLEVSDFYEMLLEEEPTLISSYWYLGLAYLLQEQQEEAQSLWIYGMTQLSPEEMEQEMLQLVEILETEAKRQEDIANYSLASLIWANLQEIDSSSIDNILHLIKVEIILNRFTPDLLSELQIIEKLQNAETDSVEPNLLLQVLSQVLEFPSVEVVSLAESSLPHITDTEAFISMIMSVAVKMAYDHQKPTYSADLTKICLQKQPQNFYLLNELLSFYSLSSKHENTLELAKNIYQNIDEYNLTPTLKLHTIYRVLMNFMTLGAWLEVEPIIQQYKNLLLEVASNPLPVLESNLKGRFLSVIFPLFYLSDNPSENRPIINRISNIFQNNLDIQLSNTKSSNKDPNKKLKIGYLASTLRKHSVGWLSRWLFQSHNYEEFDIRLYLINQPEDELTQKAFRDKVHDTYNFSRNPEKIAQKIQQDDIDILVDLDSLTNNIACQTLALKPSKIQVTWLGFDAIGLSTVDYFIADPYVLPNNAEDYYQEKIWRFPQTYLAVGGFEVGEKTLTRENLDIPEDSIIYLSVQNGFKRHPDMIYCQMKILKEVPHSYFLIKGAANDEKIQNLFQKIASDSDVDFKRLRFIPQDRDELTHRANLQIADIVLDTYPYNGATTTLEVLWMGIPLVTRVGEQFAARNSYAFMTNVGVTEGISWTNEEYIEWGIKLGKDKILRQKIQEKLMKSRQTSPLWNAPEFVLKMENAYREMWKVYCQ